MESSTSAPAFEFREILRVLGRWKLMMALVVVGAVGASAAYSFKMLPKIYQTSSTVNVNGALSGQVTPGTTSSTGSNLQGVVDAVSSLPVATMQTYLWEVTSPAVLTAAAKSLQDQGLTTTDRELLGLMSASSLPNTNLITVTARSQDPAIAAAAANAVAAAFVSQRQSEETARLADAVKFLQGQAASVQGQMDKVTQALAAAEQQAGSANQSDQNAQSGVDASSLTNVLSSYQQAKVNLEVATVGETTLENLVSAIQPTTTSTTDTTTTPVLSASPSVDVAPAGASSTTASGVSATSDSGSTTSPAGVQGPVPTEGHTVSVAPNPVYQSLMQQLEAQRVTVAEDQALVDQLAEQVAPVQQELAALHTTSPAGVPAAVAALQTQLKDLTNTYETLTSKITDTQIAQAVALTESEVTLGAPAQVPTAPVAPRKRIYVGMGLLVGLVAATALALLLDQFDRTVKSPADVRRVAPVPMLGVIPYGRG